MWHFRGGQYLTRHSCDPAPAPFEGTSLSPPGVPALTPCNLYSCTHVTHLCCSQSSIIKRLVGTGYSGLGVAS